MSAKVAVMWDSEVDWEGEKPFKKGHINTTYEYFSESAAEDGGDIYIAKFSWWNGTGLDKAFTYRNGEWRKVEDIDIDVVFDKYKFDDETIEMKKQIDAEMPVLNSFELEEICKDKLLTYEKFPDHVAATYEASEDTVEQILESGKAVLKPRYDFGGRGVKIIDSIDDYEPEEDLLVQKFVDSTQGAPSLGVEGVHDLRIIVLNGEPEVAFVRTPESGFISNVSRGGTLEKAEMKDIPEQVFEVVEEVDSEMEVYGDRMYSIDFIFDEDERPWILELNSKPGLSFYEDEDIASWKKPLIEKFTAVLTGMKD